MLWQGGVQVSIAKEAKDGGFYVKGVWGILAPRWAMDNLVFGNVAPVPEPGVESLIAMRLLAFIGRKVQARRKL